MPRKKCIRIVALGALFFFSTGHFLDLVLSQTTSAEAPLTVPYYSPPAQMELCGERVPLQSQDARERFDREFTIVVYSHAQVYLWLKRLERYFPWIEKQLSANKLPDDLKYVAVAESDLLVSACSPAGAVGPWQFISSTGSNYGLDQSRYLDERNDFEMATTSAFRYLRDLHDLFQNWTLALAAYNCGENRVRDELKRQKVSTYYALKLPLETERYVFRILAIKEVLSHPQRYGYSLPKESAYAPVSFERVKVNLPAALPVQAVAESAGMTYREFKVMNPAFISDTIPAGSFGIKVPVGKGTEFQNRLKTVNVAATPKPVSLSHKVKRGETLSGIASHYGVSAQDVREWNRLKGDRVQIGQTLKIMK